MKTKSQEQVYYEHCEQESMLDDFYENQPTFYDLYPYYDQED